jgi:hypothetical protein
MVTAMTPRFPELDARGRVRQEIRLWHYRPDAVTITSVVATRYHLQTEPGTPPRDPVREEVKPESVLGKKTVPPGDGITFPAELDTTLEPDVAYIEFFVEGVSAEGLPAHGNFAVMRPPPKPTADNHVPVRSKYLEAKILRARELLGKAFVTDEEIWELERQGAFADLRREDFPAPDPEPEPTRAAPGAAPPRPQR